MLHWMRCRYQSVYDVLQAVTPHLVDGGMIFLDDVDVRAALQP